MNLNLDRSPLTNGDLAAIAARLPNGERFLAGLSSEHSHAGQRSKLLGFTLDERHAMWARGELRLGTASPFRPGPARQADPEMVAFFLSITRPQEVPCPAS